MQRLVWVCLLFLFACSKKDDPDSVANAFVDAYYIEFDVARAQTMAVGGAARRLAEETALASDARKRMQVERQKARVYYEPPEKRRVAEDMAHYTYELDIRRADSKVKRSTIIMLAKRDGAWKVLRFREVGAGGALQKARTSTRTEP